MASSKDEIETETHNNNETDKSSNLEDTQKQGSFFLPCQHPVAITAVATMIIRTMGSPRMITERKYPVNPLIIMAKCSSK